jgi:large subunit ribosomal protein L40e
MRFRLLAAAAAALLFTASAASAETIFVRTLAGAAYTFDMGFDRNVEDLKQAIADSQGIPVEQQRLIFAGRQLEDGHTLGEYNIENESTLHLVLRMQPQ